MTELFLEQSAEVLDDWEAVRQDGNLSDSMRWSPDAPPRQTVPMFSCVGERILGESFAVAWSALVRTMAEQLQPMMETTARTFTYRFRLLATPPRRRSKPERRAAAREALAMRRRCVVYDAPTDTYLLPDGCIVDAPTANRNLQRAFDSLDPFSYPQPTRGAAEYHRRRRARARRRR